MNCLHDAHGISLKLSRQPVLRDHLRGFHTNDMRTQNLAVLFAGNQLDEACRLTDRHSLATSLKGELADLVLQPLFLAGAFRQTNTGDVRLAIGAARHVLCVEGWQLVACYLLHAGDRFVRRLVGEPRRTGHITHRVHAINVGAHVAVHFDCAALEVHTYLLEAKVLDVAGDANGHQAIVGVQRDLFAFFLEHHAGAIALLLGGLDLAAQVTVDALLLQLFGQFLADVVVLDWQQAVLRLDDVHLSSEGVKEVGELNADRAGTDHHELLRALLDHHRFFVCQHAFVIDVHAWEGTGASPGGDDDVLGSDRVGLLAVFVVNGITWSLLDNLVADATVPTDRQLFTGDFIFPATPISTELAWTGMVSSDWNTTESNWINGSPTPWLNGIYGLARFQSGAPNTVNVTEPIDARVLQFTAPGYSVNGGTITLTGVNRIDAVGNAEVSSTIDGSAGMTKTGSGTLLLTGESTYPGPTSVRGGTLGYGNSGSRTVVANLEIGIPDDSAVLEQSGTSNIVFGGNPGLGNGNKPTGIIRQTGGTSTYAAGGGYLTIGNGTNAFGAIELSGGTLSTGENSGIRIGGTGNGSIVQTEGELISDRWFAIGGTDSIGTVTLLGGNTTVTSGWSLIIGDRAGATATVNIGTMTGGSATLTTRRSSTDEGSIVLAKDSSLGYLNLNSGTIEAHGAIYGGGAAYFNANGGTLRAGTDGVELCKAEIQINAYQGGLHVDTNGFNALLSSSILQPFGPGVYLTDGTLMVPSGGSGYLTAPLVEITSDSLLGLDATAVAEVTNGVVTGITMTNPGNGYEIGDTLNFSFIGGSPNIPATDVEHVITSGDLDDGSSGGTFSNFCTSSLFGTSARHS